MSHRLLAVAGAVLALFIGANPAQAALIDFDQPSLAGGTITFDSGTGLLTGTDIEFTSIDVLGAPVNDGTYACTDGGANLGCTLDFSITATSTSTVAGITTADFDAAGGSITLTGTSIGSTSPTLLTGTFDGSAFNSLTLGFGTGIFTGSGTDTKDTGFLSTFGLVNPFGFVSTNFSLGGCVTNGTLTTCDVTEADLANINEQGPDVVPEPGSILLLGGGLLGLAAAVRRRTARR